MRHALHGLSKELLGFFRLLELDTVFPQVNFSGQLL